MITTADLKTQTRRELADLARNYGVTGWHGMKKAELIDEIHKVQRKSRRQTAAVDKKTAPKKTAARPVEKTTKRRAGKPSPAPDDRGTSDAKSARIRAQLRRRRETTNRHRVLTTHGTHHLIRRQLICGELVGVNKQPKRRIAAAATIEKCLDCAASVVFDYINDITLISTLFSKI